MKKRTLFLGLVLCLILSLAIAGCSASGSSNASSSSSVEHVEAQLKIQDIYALYAANAEQTGETPLSYEEWLASVKGEDGKDGANGLSAYEIWLANGYSGTQGDFLNWIKGQDGAPGKDGQDGQDGQDGKDGLSAYQIWLNAGHTGSEQDFLNWLKGEDGKDLTTCEHSFSEWTVSLEATCSSIGYKTRECLICGNVEYQFTSEKGHKFEFVYELVNNCQGIKCLYACSICLMTKYVIEQPTASHNYQNDVCTICGEEMPKWDGTIATEFAGGSGTESDPYLISTGAQLAYLANGINSSDSNELYDKHYLLLNDINLNGLEWEPIGRYYYSNSSISSLSRTFQGVFNGNGYVISNFKITQPWHSFRDYFGLFGSVSGTIKNLGVENFVIDVTATIYAFVGGLAGGNVGTISNCYATGDVNVTATSIDGGADVGGLIGRNVDRGIISSCYATGDVSATAEDGSNAGGLIGYNWGTLKNCYATGDVNVTAEDGSTYAGGLIGENWGTLKNCYAMGDISVITDEGSAIAGGLIGENCETISNCYATGDVSATATLCGRAGGLTGENWGTLKNCYATGDVSAKTSIDDRMYNGAYVGGLIGQNSGNISNCYAMGNVSVTANKYASAGGLVGNYNSGSIADCYRYEGQIITLDKKGTVTNTPSNILGTACTLEQLNSKEFYTETLLWDETIWNFVELDFEKGKYPTLIGE